MRARLPNPTAWAALAAILAVFGLTVPLQLRQAPAASEKDQEDTPARPDRAPSMAATALLERAILTLENYPVVGVKSRQRGVLFGQEPIGSGVYQQQLYQNKLLFRMELTLQVGDQPSSLVHVCDEDRGQSYLWMYRKLPDQDATISRIDVERVIGALEETGNIRITREVGQWPGLGGLPKLLRGLHASFDFASLEATRLPGRFPVWKMRGRWKPDKLALLLPEQRETIAAGKPADLSRLPDHLPHYVLLFLGKRDLFPRRVEYRRRDATGEHGEKVPQDRPLVTLELFELNLADPIPATRFKFPDVPDFSDKTDSFLKGLDLDL